MYYLSIDTQKISFRNSKSRALTIFYTIVEIILPGWRFLVGFAGVGQNSLSLVVLERL
jgi:hypothetical protein